VRIQINGEPREFPEDRLSLNQLIDTLSLPPQRIAIEVNKTIVRRAEWEKTKLKDGDQIEIVHFVGGGADRADRRQKAGGSKRRETFVRLANGVKSIYIHSKGSRIHVITSKRNHRSI
jgi:thiamine biosynthesis protein ThiS